MIVELSKKPEVEILSVVPVSDAADFPAAVHYVYKGRRFMTFADDKDYMKAARASLLNPRIKFEDLLDVTQCVLCIIMNSNDDFYGCEQYRKAFEGEANLDWATVVYNLLHDIVKHRLHKFFHYGNGSENLCVYLDILSEISFPCKEGSRPF